MQQKVIRFEDEAWTEPFPQLDSPQTVVFVFGAPEYIDNTDPITELVDAYPQSAVVGCSSSGEIHDEFVYDKSLVVAVAKFAKTRLKTAVAPITAESSHEAGRSIAQQLTAPDLHAVILLSDGLAVNGTEMVNGVNEVLAGDVSVTGGLAGDGPRFERTWTIVDGKPASGFVTAVALYGPDIWVGHGSRGGWDKFGPEREVTKALGNVLFELDNKPALDLYKQYLGERASGLPATGLLFPLSIRANEEDEKQLVRTILSVDEEENSMTFAGDVPEGYRAQLMQANFDRLVGGAEDAAIMARTGDLDGPFLAIAISCVGRRLVLGERTEDELEATMAAMPEESCQVGFYSYGELSPHTSGDCDLHNQTMTLTVIAER